MHRDITLESFDEVYLHKSNKWLNDPEIQHLIDCKSVTIESQFNWFNGLENRTDYKIWGVACEGIPIGAAGLRHISKIDAEFFCYVGEKDYWGGVGRPILIGIENNARKVGLTDIWLKVTKDNNRAKNLYDRMGYSVYDRDAMFYYMKKKII